jgi:hypothetical protein
VSDDELRREVQASPGGRLHDSSLPGVPAEEAARADLQQRLEAVTRVVLRPLASPLPLGFLALAAATLLVSALQLGWLALDQQQPVALALIAFVAPCNCSHRSWGSCPGTASPGRAWGFWPGPG